MIIEHNSGWQKEDGQYYNQLLNGNRVPNGTYRGKVLELQGYPTVLGDDGSTFYTLDEDGTCLLYTSRCV